MCKAIKRPGQNRLAGLFFWSGSAFQKRTRPSGLHWKLCWQASVLFAAPQACAAGRRDMDAFAEQRRSGARGAGSGAPLRWEQASRGSAQCLTSFAADIVDTRRSTAPSAEIQRCSRAIDASSVALRDARNSRAVAHASYMMHAPVAFAPYMRQNAPGGHPLTRICSI